MLTLWNDVRVAVRSLRRRFLITLLAAVSLALALMGNITVFSIITGLFFRPLPYEEPNRIVFLGERYPDDSNVVASAAAANFLDWQAETRSFREMAAFLARSFNLSSEDRPETISGAEVSPSFFSVLGRRMLQGPGLGPENGTPGRDRVVVLSHQFWESRFGADPKVIGQDLRISDRPYSIVGVLPEDFEFLTPNIQLWVPLVLDRANASRTDKDLLVVARLNDGVSMADARSEMESLGKRLEEAFPKANRGSTLEVLNLREDIPGTQNRQVFGLMQGAMVFVLLIACANVANLLIAKGQERQADIVIRSVLGSGRWRIIRQLLTESLVLAGLGGLLGLLLSAAAVKLITSAMASALPSFFAPVIDLRVIAFTGGIAIFAGLVFGILPALTARPDLFEVLRGASVVGGLRRRRLFSNIFVVGEIAAALILLGGASILIQSFVTIQTADPGFETERLLTGRIDLPVSKYEEDGERTDFYSRFLERLEAVPGVRNASLTSGIPRSPVNPKSTFTIEGRTGPQEDPAPRAICLTTSPSYLETLGIPLIRGRFIESSDRLDAPAVAVISQSFARRYWPEENPVGKSLEVQDRQRRIVGVVGDVQQEMVLGEELSQMVIYLPAAQSPLPGLHLVLRTEGDRVLVAKEVERVYQSFDPDLVPPALQTYEEYLAQFMAGAQVFIALLGGFGSLALFLASVGTYGLVTYSALQRTREIGVRMALGAHRGQILRMVTWQGLKLGAIALLIGIPGSLALSRLIRSAMSGLVEIETGGLVLASLALLTAIIAACILPARRAAGVDPAEALRFSP